MSVRAMFAAALLAGVARAAAFPSAPPPDKIHYDLQDAESLFQEFIAQHNKVYINIEEHFKRFEIFKEHLRVVNELNENHPDTVYVIYHFADRTPEEMFHLKPFNASAFDAVKPHFPGGFVDAPESLDYRDRGVVAPVKDQGQCFSCYIFSAIGTIEGQYALKHQQCISLSEQQYLDCVTDNDCKTGGWMHEVMQQLVNDKAACMAEEDYPYIAQKGSCHEDVNKKIVTVLGGQVLKIEDEEELQQALLQYGPLAVTLDGDDIKSYSQGIFESPCEGRTSHGVLLIGYGEENGKKFWIIKNSWGEKWGEKGYMRILRGRNLCRMGTAYTAAAQVD